MSTTNGDAMEFIEGGGGKKKDKMTVEKIYQKKSQLEHILLRPDTYIGSVEFVTESMWIYEQETKHMVQTELTYVPGLYKIFDEILVNAADNKQRDPSMDTIRINIDKENNSISIWNNGTGIPVVMHKDENMYVPTMIFGHLLTSSNYNDEEEKVTGGRNGYGAKLCNIFSTKFTVETATKEYKRCFKQTWTNNMLNACEPKIKDFFGNDYTQITFSPDLTKFKMTSLDDDIVKLMSRRAYDVAASSRGVKVYLNGEKLPVKNFKDYVDLYIQGKVDDVGNPLKCVYDVMGERWEVAVAISDRGFQQVSFVNSIATTKGGRHIDHVAEMLVKKLIETINKKNQKGMSVKPFQVKNHMWLFVNCLIVNPTFDSQTKEHMTLQAKSFGSKCNLTDKFVNQVVKCGIVEAVVQWAQFKAQTQLQKSSSNKKVSKLKGVPKLDDANLAGTGKSNECTLILTEGDSAKALAMAGLGVVGRDRYGVFPLRGKLLNVREATHKQILENAEINNLIKIIGLQYKKKYLSTDDMKSLRYGKVMIMTDQDQDGSHIKGLLINFFHYNWPELLQRSFLEEFITPIVKATKGNEVFSFYSIPEYDEWRQSKPNWYTYKIKYYKGLGTSTSKEAKEYFSDMERHRIVFKYHGQTDDQHITMAFAKKCVDQRKDWLTNWMEEVKKRKEVGLAEDYLYEKDTKEISYTDFINKELVLFSNYDNERSIPSLMDGLKPGQRKVLFTCLKRNDKREVKVAQLAGSVAEHSAYHHGEASLMATIINLAQNFVGSNNINLLQPIGQFGSRVNGGKDAASPRYIFTMLSPLVKCIFHPDDQPLLTWNYDDNQKVEPVWYCPIIPMVLVNGSDGIGTGWMTKVLNYNPRELISNLELMINGEEPKPLMPWYKNFKGVVKSIGSSRYVFFGEISVLPNNKVEITELPIGVWTQVYKENVLEPMLHGGEKIQATINEYKEYSTDTTVRFLVSLSQEELIKAENEGLHKYFKLQTTLTTSSMCLFDNYGCLRKFESIIPIFNEYFAVRKEFYVKRKAYNEGLLESEARKLSNQARFILEKCDGILKIENKKKKIMIDELIERKYDPDPVRLWKKERSLIEAEAEMEAQGISESRPGDKEKQVDEEDENTKNYDYLLGMTMWTLTKERKDALLKQKDEKNNELVILKEKTPSQIWLEDLEILKKELDKWEQKELKQDEVVVKGKGGKGKAAIKEYIPNANARKVEAVIDEETLKKFTKLEEAKEKRKKKTKGVIGSDNSEKDEFDTSLKPLAERLNNSPEKIEKEAKKKLKQSKLNFKKKEKDEEVLPKREKLARTSASKALEKWASTKDSDDSSFAGHFSATEDEPDSDDMFAPKKKAKKTKAQANLNQSSEEMFDTLFSKEKAPAAAAASEKPKATKGDGETKKRGRQIGAKSKKAKKAISSDSEDFVKAPSKKKAKAKKQDSDLEDDDDDMPSIPVEPRAGGRARKPITYDIDSDFSD